MKACREHEDTKTGRNKLSIVRNEELKYSIIEIQNGKERKVSGEYESIKLIGKKFAIVKNQYNYEAILRRRDGIYMRVSDCFNSIELLRGGKHAITTDLVTRKGQQTTEEYILAYNGRKFEKSYGPYEEIKLEKAPNQLKILAFKNDVVEIFVIKNGKIKQIY